MEKKSQLIRGYIAMLFAVLFWGLSFVWTKQLLNNGFTPVAIITFRLFIATASLWIFFSMTKKINKVKKNHIPLFLLLSFFQPFLYFFGENAGLKYVDASLASIIVSTIPIFVPFGLRLIYKESLRWQVIIGVVISVIGIIFMSSGQQVSLLSNAKGISLMFLAVFSAVAYNMVLAKIVHLYGPITISSYQNVFSLMMYIPVFLLFELNSIGSIVINAQTLIALFGLSVLCSAVSFILLTYAMKRLTIYKTAPMENLVPVFTMIFAAMIGLETFSINKILGVIIVLIGLSISQIKFKKG